LVAKPEGKRLLRRSRHEWDNIKLDCRKIGLEGVDWTDLAQDRYQWYAVVNTVLNFWVPE
jgi:hypothetical protein